MGRRRPRALVRFPDVRLKQVCEPVDPRSRLGRRIARDLVETLEAAPGVGLAAPQIGYLRRVIVVDAARSPRHEGQGRFLLFNPRIVDRSGRQLAREGCLSVPEYTGNVARAAEVLVEGKDAAGACLCVRARGFEAVVFQHEIDHLDGILFLDRIANLRTDLFRRARERQAAFARREVEDAACPPPGRAPQG